MAPLAILDPHMHHNAYVDPKYVANGVPAQLPPPLLFPEFFLLQVSNWTNVCINGQM